MPAKNKQSKTAKRRTEQNSTRTVEAEVRQDSQARNLLSSQPKLTPRSTKRTLKKAELKKELRSAKLYGKKKERVYSEKELNLPILNKAILPGSIKKSGKKGKIFVKDDDTNILNKLIKQINDDKDLINESKLEKSKRLEEIRQFKLQEIQSKQEEKLNKLNDKKVEIKNKSNTARLNRRKNAKETKKSIIKQADKKVKSVSFA
ncbi:hypothetical protein CANARDRAFT_28069 [[Candida] arabinofermentans NRRL YB-2248]|uniref:60S ribosomal subunit assembly/export protein LOC1 n=1 Tax=[Candida] arabinofermentans NRRL YB-2248 TaxID=983967 RepID=A0A1E4T2P3_9ASCO|nr:hypothetical protein CANARDRAFT_28069 [[Candida] arabinofermentans NRRL YB-2248]